MPDRIVGDRGKLDHRIESFEVGLSDRPDIAGELLVAVGLVPEGATVVPSCVQADDLKAALDQDRNHHSAEIPSIAIDKYTHCGFPT
jgi:hypothetical protein